MSSSGSITSDRLSTAVVILNWNGAEMLRRFLPSVVEHTPEWVSIVVADNGSDDESCDVVERLFGSRVELLRLSMNYGFAGGYNQALSRLDHQLFVLLNSDVEVTAGWFEPLYDRLSENDMVGAVAPKLRSAIDRERFDYAGAAGGLIDYLGYPFCRGRVLDRIEVDHGQYDSAADVFWASGAAFACRADLFHRLGGFDNDYFAHMEEIDLCWRMQLLGFKVCVEPSSVVYHLGGGTLQSGSKEKRYLNHRNNLMMIYKCASINQLMVIAVLRPWLEIATAASYIVQRRWDYLAAIYRAWGDFMRGLAALQGKRRIVQRSAVASPRGIYRGSILFK